MSSLATSSSYKYYIVNNEKVSYRVGSKQNINYTVSACPFVTFKTEDTINFQMLSDINFSMITTKKSSLEFHIVAIKNNSNDVCKRHILDYFNKNVENSDIKVLFTFECKIENYLKNNQLSIPEKNNSSIEINLMVNDYNGNIYISNPEFSCCTWTEPCF